MMTVGFFDRFNKSAEPPAPAELVERLLRELGCKFERRSNGTIFVPGDLSLQNKGLTELPDLSSVEVGGDFKCSFNKLTSLKGSPKSVGGMFKCENNQLTSLEGATQTIGDSFWCDNNPLTTLKGGPVNVGGSLHACSTQLTSLEGLPQHIGRDVYFVNGKLTSLKFSPAIVTGEFNCSGNNLTSLEGGPEETGDYTCKDNPLLSLEHAPRKFFTINSPFGSWKRWEEIPENLRFSEKTLIEMKQAALDKAVEKAVTLQDNVTVRRPLRLRSQPQPA